MAEKKQYNVEVTRALASFPYFVLKNEKRIGYDGSYEDFALNIIPLFQDVTVNVSSFSSICRKLSKRDNEVKDERLTERKKLKQQLTQKLEEALK